MLVELDTMEKTKTWTVTSLPKNQHTVGSKCIYKVKFHPDGKTDRYKKWLIIKDSYSQQEGINFFDTFSSHCQNFHCESFFFFLTLVTLFNCQLAQMDVNNVFLNEDLFEEVYMSLPMAYKPL